MKAGFVFPGQGSQRKGMLAELAETFPIIEDTFREASAALDYDLWSLVQLDPDGELSRTSITQPAILTSSVAIWRLWQQQGGFTPTLLAGHSLGEYSALVAAGVLDFSDAVGLVRKRGEYMQSAVPVGVGAMAAIVGLEDAAVVQACAEAAGEEVVSAVNFNSPGQVVIAGHAEAVGRAVERCKAAGAKRALPLPVSAPFHCALMKPAAESFSENLADIHLRRPQIPVIQNFNLKLESDPEAIRQNLVAQIYSPVPWVKTVEIFASESIERIYEIGPGKVLSGLVKRITPSMKVLSVNDPNSLQAGLDTDK